MAVSCSSWSWSSLRSDRISFVYSVIRWVSPSDGRVDTTGPVSSILIPGLYRVSERTLSRMFLCTLRCWHLAGQLLVVRLLSLVDKMKCIWEKCSAGRFEKQKLSCACVQSALGGVFLYLSWELRPCILLDLFWVLLGRANSLEFYAKIGETSWFWKKSWVVIYRELVLFFLISRSIDEMGWLVGLGFKQSLFWNF